MNAPTLFEIEAPSPTSRRDDGENSRKAAELAERSAGKGRAIVLNALVEFGPMTDHEISVTTGRHLGSTAKRRLDLMRHAPPLVASAGRNRLSPSGSPATVWQATDAGHRLVGGDAHGEAR
jgi:hypothetical protein